MRNFITILVFLFFNTILYGQNSFVEIVKEVEKVDYKILNKPENEIINPKDNWYTKIIKIINSNESYDKISIENANKVLNIQILYIKGKKQIMPSTFGRAEIQEWCFKNSEDAKIFADELENNSFVLKERLHKAPWSFWQNKNKVYFILTGGTYMSGDLLKIKEKLKKKTI